jgi:hypothetical protein
MGAVIEDVEAARALPPPPAGGTYSVQAYAVRQRVKRTGFAELRSAFVRFGGSLTPQFLQLDNEITVFAQQVMTTFNSATGAPTLLGANAGLSEQLEHIEQQARTLRHEAEVGMRRCRDELAKERIDLAP